MEKSEIIIQLYSTVILLLFFGGVIILLVAIFKKKQRSNREQMNKLQQTMLKSQLEIQEQTMTSISRELHDNIAQNLGVINLYLNGIGSVGHADKQEKLEMSRRLLKKVNRQIRLFSHNLLGESIEMAGLGNAIQKEVALLNTIQHTHFTFENFAIANIKGERAIILFRVVQEALQNVIRHAKAAHCDIVMHEQQENIAVSITDDGIGFSEAGLDQSGGIGVGLLNMKSRTHIAGGKIFINSLPGKGTKIELLFSVN